MRVIEARNVHCALPKALRLLHEHGIHRESRGGPVIVAPWPVTTVYQSPLERVIFWPERDANPFLHLYESLWMLAGRNDVAPLEKFTKRFARYSDDGKIIHDAYGYRWRNLFSQDQLLTIIGRLKRNPDDRRCVLQMWSVSNDLGKEGRAFPCNLVATFQRSIDGRLDIVVFCRSNDIIWGCYGANAVHFSTLLEYMALKIGCPVGIYTHVSVNWHAYTETVVSISEHHDHVNPYDYAGVTVLAMPDSARIDALILDLLEQVDNDFVGSGYSNNHWYCMIYDVLYAHHLFKTLATPEKYIAPIELLSVTEYFHIDWVVAAREWLQRRYANWEKKMKVT